MHFFKDLCNFKLFFQLWTDTNECIFDSRLVPGYRAGIAAAAVGGGHGSSGRSLVRSIKICISISSWTARRLKHWEWSDVNGATKKEKTGREKKKKKKSCTVIFIEWNLYALGGTVLLLLQPSHWKASGIGLIITQTHWDKPDHLREEAFFPAEFGTRPSLAFRLPVLLDELKSASLPADANRITMLAEHKTIIQVTTSLSLVVFLKSARVVH